MYDRSTSRSPESGVLDHCSRQPSCCSLMLPASARGAVGLVVPWRWAVISWWLQDPIGLALTRRTWIAAVLSLVDPFTPSLYNVIVEHGPLATIRTPAGVSNDRRIGVLKAFVFVRS